MVAGLKLAYWAKLSEMHLSHLVAAQFRYQFSVPLAHLSLPLRGDDDGRRKKPLA